MASPPSQEAIQTPQIKSEQKAEGPAKSEQHPTQNAPSVAASDQPNCCKVAEHREEEGTEFWPAFLGVRLKITDTLLAAFTFGLVIFTGFLWRSTHKLWKATIAAVDLARAEFTSTHRPRIAVRRFELRPIKAGESLHIDYRVVNVGETPAHLLQVNATIMFGHVMLPGVPEYDETKTIKFTDTSLASGQYAKTQTESEWKLQEHLIEAGAFDSTSLIVAGFVRYRDDAGIVRQMAFGRSYSKGHFRVMDHPEYEYAD